MYLNKRSFQSDEYVVYLAIWFLKKNVFFKYFLRIHHISHLVIPNIDNFHKI